MNFIDNIFLINLKKHINETGDLVSIDYEKDLIVISKEVYCSHPKI